MNRADFIAGIEFSYEGKRYNFRHRPRGENYQGCILLNGEVRFGVETISDEKVKFFAVNRKDGKEVLTDYEVHLSEFQKEVVNG